MAKPTSKRRLALIGVLLFIAGVAVYGLPNRYHLITYLPSGRGLYRIDKWTGRTWRMLNGRWERIDEPSWLGKSWWWPGILPWVDD